MSVEIKSSNKVHGGVLHKLCFVSTCLGGLSTLVNVFVPPPQHQDQETGKETDKVQVPVPVLYYLAGLTCTEDNGAQKGNFLGAASEERIAVVFPDTSPRGAGIPTEKDSYDLGEGAGFYLNATKPPWSTHYRMYDYILNELPAKLIDSGLPLDTSRASITGHSMGGHGALTLYLRGEGKYRSCSAFAPICNPSSSACEWGQKAFSTYLQGGIQEGERLYDATSLLLTKSKSKSTQTNSDSDSDSDSVRILVDYGSNDQFNHQLTPLSFQNAATRAGFAQVQVREQIGYDHSYYFISTFAPEHVRFHAKFLKA